MKKLMNCRPTMDYYEEAWCATHDRAVAECIAAIERERDELAARLTPAALAELKARAIEEAAGIFDRSEGVLSVAQAAGWMRTEAARIRAEAKETT